MAHRHIGRFARLDGKGYADNFGVHITQAGGFGVEGELVGGFQAFQPLVELRLFGDHRVLFLNGLAGSVSEAAAFLSLADPAFSSSAIQLRNSYSLNSSSRLSSSCSRSVRSSSPNSSSTSRRMVASSRLRGRVSVASRRYSPILP